MVPVRPKRYMRKIAFPSRSQALSILGGLVNLALAFPQYLPILHTWGLDPTPNERKIIGVLTVLAMWRGRSLDPSKSGLPGQQSQPTTPTSAASAVADTPTASANNAAVNNAAVNDQGEA